MAFSPKPGDTFSILGHEYRACSRRKPRETPAAAPDARDMHKQGTDKGTVYRLERVDDSSPWALKVLIKKLQSPLVERVSLLLQDVGPLPGLDASRRTVLTPANAPDLLRRFPELTYAVLMPWSPGRSWSDIIYTRTPITLDDGLRLARATAELLHGLERHGLAHCDIAGTNVFVDLESDPVHVQVVDLEELYHASFRRPTEGKPLGSSGYHHWSSRSQTQWCAEGDRFPGAVLLAEMLTWHDEAIRRRARREQYFAEDDFEDPDTGETNPEGARFLLMRDTLDALSAGLKELFVRVWHARSMADCPTLQAWAEVIDHDLGPLVALGAAIHAGSDREIALAGQSCRHTLDRNPGLFSSHRDRVTLAVRRCQAADAVRDALASRDMARLDREYARHAGALSATAGWPAENRQRIEALLELGHGLVQGLTAGREGTLESEGKIEDIYRRVNALWAEALATEERAGGAPQAIGSAGVAWADALSAYEMARLELALGRMESHREIARLKKASSDRAIVAALLANQALLAGFAPVESDSRVKLASRRVEWLARLDQALERGDEDDILRLHARLPRPREPFPDFVQRTHVEQIRHRRALRAQEQVRRAVLMEEDEEICLLQPLLEDALLPEGTIDADQAARVQRAAERLAAHRRLVQHLADGEVHQAVSFYEENEPLLRACSAFTAADRWAIQSAREQIAAEELHRAVAGARYREEVDSAFETAIRAGWNPDESTYDSLRAAARSLPSKERAPG